MLGGYRREAISSKVTVLCLFSDLQSAASSCSLFVTNVKSKSLKLSREDYFLLPE